MKPCIPGDGRTTGSDTNVLMQVINGHKFMFATGQSGGGWNIYKQVPWDIPVEALRRASVLVRPGVT